MELKKIGLTIKTLRKNKKMTQDELAILSGYSNRSAISRIENGEIDLPESKIIAISKALGVTPHHLVGWDTIKEDKKMLNGKYDISMLDELEIKKVEKFMSFNEVMFMNEDNELTEDDKNILINSYIQILIQQRNK
ncbi:helix-turn-helix domain-containing protein [Streptobacillus moniliformis]|uniref:helix-turn-helix domain-containing protein n=1 Tax=Streptobacillus moniliformis TaxID=34105 RepID=UPI0007E3D8FB|nr:helix-turn-helix transcriptional regulator [Streptobacillus moniliformis]